jgi:PKD repeat protein
LTVNFSSAGSSDPEGDPLTYAWTFGDGATSLLANPVHTYGSDGPYSVRLTVSDGTVSSFATITVRVGNPPVPTILAPTNGALFLAGQQVTFNGSAVDPEDGVLTASAFTWTIDFLHEGHVHPGVPQVGSKSGIFVIPTAGHDFHEFTRYRFTLTATDSDGLQGLTSVTIFPDKVNLSFDSAPSGLALTLDGIPHATPFVYDTLKGFVHQLGAPDHPGQPLSYAFDSWSDGGPRDHALVVPDAAASFLATYKRMLRFNSLTPCRLIDTRLTVGPEAASPALAGSGIRTFEVAGKCGLPPTASALSVNVTVTDPKGAGFLTVYPADLPAPPIASSINFQVGDTRANNAVVHLATNGTGINVVNGSKGTVELIIDVNGWFE